MTRDDTERRMISPDRDITPLLSSKLPQLRLGRFPIYEVVDVGTRVISHIYLFRRGAAMFLKEKERALLAAGVAIFVGGALEFFVARVVSKAFATPFVRRGLSIQCFKDVEAFEKTAIGPV